MSKPRDWFPADSRMPLRSEVVRARRDPFTRQAGSVWYHILAAAKRCNRGGLLVDDDGPLTREDIADVAGVVVPAECPRTSADASWTVLDILGRVLDALTKWGWLDEQDGCFRVVKWADWNASADEALDTLNKRRAADAQRKRDERAALKAAAERAKMSSDASADSPRMSVPYTDTDTDTDTTENTDADSDPSGEVLEAEVVDDAPAPKSTRSRAPRDKTPEPEIPDWVPRAEWDAFDASRRHGKGKASWTPTARTMALRTLSDLRDAGEDPAAVLRASVVGGWSGLFPVRRGGQSALPLGARRGGYSTEVLMRELNERRRRERDGGGDGTAQ